MLTGRIKQSQSFIFTELVGTNLSEFFATFDNNNHLISIYLTACSNKDLMYHFFLDAGLSFVEKWHINELDIENDKQLDLLSTYNLLDYCIESIEATPNGLNSSIHFIFKCVSVNNKSTDRKTADNITLSLQCQNPHEFDGVCEIIQLK